MSNSLNEITVQVPSDPDAQATVTDFLDYTEYLPSDLVRSLTLIKNLDTLYTKSSTNVHELTKVYGDLPGLGATEKTDATKLRSQISENLNHAIAARESSFAEASRLYDVVDRHFNRLSSIITKLEALPKPPSRDPTPVPQPSPQSARPRGPKGEDNVHPRITLRFDGARASDRPAGSVARHKSRNRRVTVPGEVLPPPNPDSPPASTDSDWESSPPSPIPMPTSRVGSSARSRHRIKPPKPPKLKKIKIPKPPRRVRPPGVMGTNVHSAVAGISTSNALALLKPPPDDAVPGSEDAPWLKLTTWEMAKLRKRMKKNAVWNPSETMIRRELSQLGRGPENYHLAKAKAEAEGLTFVDAANISNEPKTDKKNLAEGEISVESLGVEEMQLSNRGMKLNEAKKLKKENQAKELAAAAAADAEQAARALAASGSALKNIFTPRAGVEAADYMTASPSKPEKKEPAKSPRKRKRDDKTTESEERTTQGSPSSMIVPLKSPKKRKTTPAPLLTSISTTNSLPILPSSASKLSTPTLISPPLPSLTPTPPAVAPSSRRASISKQKTPSASPAPQQPSHRSFRGSTEEPTPAPISVLVKALPPPVQITAGKDRPRRSSRSSIVPQTPVTEPAPAPRDLRRSKRPAPGPVQSESGGTTVSVGRRKAAPRKSKKGKVAEAGAQKEEEDPAEDIDPDEPRYCICGDVSWGTMVACENEDCENEWFHLKCVGLSATPGSRIKWYCPDCRKALGVSERGKSVEKSTRKSR